MERNLIIPTLVFAGVLALFGYFWTHFDSAAPVVASAPIENRGEVGKP